MAKEVLSDCMKVFYAAVKQKDGKDFKTSSLRTIRAAIERYLKQPPLNKPWSIVGDPAFESASKVLNANCRKNAQEGKASPIVHKQPITKEQVQQLFKTGQLGECNTHDPVQLLRTTWFYITLYFGKRGRKKAYKRNAVTSVNPPKVANSMSLKICWEVKTTKAACMITTMNQMAKCLQFQIP